MKVIPTELPDVLVVEPVVYEDQRGFFYENFSQRQWECDTGLRIVFVQDNHPRSLRGVMRGLHYQLPRRQGKLVQCIVGEIFDVAVDLRISSPTVGRCGPGCGSWRRTAGNSGCRSGSPTVSSWSRTLARSCTRRRTFTIQPRRSSSYGTIPSWRSIGPCATRSFASGTHEPLVSRSRRASPDTAPMGMRHVRRVSLGICGARPLRLHGGANGLPCRPACTEDTDAHIEPAKEGTRRWSGC